MFHLQKVMKYVSTGGLRADLVHQVMADTFKQVLHKTQLKGRLLHHDNAPGQTSVKQQLSRILSVPRIKQSEWP